MEITKRIGNVLADNLDDMESVVPEGNQILIYSENKVFRISIEEVEQKQTD